MEFHSEQNSALKNGISELLSYAQSGNLKGIKGLLSKKVDPNVKAENGNTALMFAAIFDEDQIVKCLLEDASVDIALQNKRGLNVVHHSCVNNSARVLPLLLNEKYDSILRVGNNWAETPAHLAAGAGNVEVLKMLIEYGLDMNVKDSWGRTPWGVAKENGYSNRMPFLEEVTKIEEDVERSQILEKRSENKNDVMLKELFAEVKKKAPGEDVARKAEERVQNVYNVKSANAKPIQIPKKKALSKMLEYPGSIQIIQNALTDEEIDLNGKDFYGLTALHKISGWNKVDMLELLVPALNDDEMNCVDNSGKSCLDFTLDMGAKNSFQYLRSSGRLKAEFVEKAEEILKQAGCNDWLDD